MNENAGRTQVWLWLTVPIAILLAIAAGKPLQHLILSQQRREA